MNILILMAGSGHRFRQAGYKEHKPMIDVLGKPMIERVIENLTPKYREHNFIFVTLSAMTDERVLKILRKPNSTIVELPYITEGSVCSALKAQGLIDNEEPLLIASCDQLVDIDIDEFIDASWFSDGALLTFPSDRPHCSFAKVKDGYVTEVAEKRVISNHANVGLYWFKDGCDFVLYANQMINRDIRINGEFYIAPIYNQLIAGQGKVTIHEIPKNKVHLLGTPAELESYNDYAKATSKASR
jgi:NDP-sugar pyrophosphorylase family protein